VGEYARAASVYDALIQRNADPETVRQAQLRLARLKVTRLNQVREGLALYETLLQTYPRHPESAEAAWELGRHAYQQGDYEGARRHFLRLILDFSGSPFDANGRIWLAAVYERLENRTAAKDAYGAFLERYPNDPRRAEIQQRLVALREGQPLSPPSPEVEQSKPTSPVARTSQSAPRTNEEARRLDDAPERRTFGPPTRPNAVAEMATWTDSPIFGYNPRLLFTEGGRMFGGDDVETSVRSDGALLDDALMNLGMLYFQNGTYRQAGACLEKVLQLVPQLSADDTEMLIALTVCYIRVGVSAKAQEVFRRAYGLDSAVMKRMLAYADSLEEGGSPDRARATLSMMLGADPKHDAEIQQRLDRAARSATPNTSP
jgi:tetratricopeptide (TPR) repeat protein